MPRIRTIKPSFWGDEKVARLSRDARLLFLGLISMADDEGRLLGAARQILGDLYPHDEAVSEADIDRWMAELVRARVVRRYTVRRVIYVSVTNFRQHQRIDKPSPSSLPGPPKRKRSRSPAGSRNAPRTGRELIADGFSEPFEEEPSSHSSPDKEEEEEEDKEREDSEAETSGFVDATSYVAPDPPPRDPDVNHEDPDPDADPDLEPDPELERVLERNGQTPGGIRELRRHFTRAELLAKYADSEAG